VSRNFCKKDIFESAKSRVFLQKPEDFNWDNPNLD